MNVRRTLAIAAAAMLATTTASAQSFDTGIGNVAGGYAVDGPAQRVDVSTATTVTKFSVWLKTVSSELPNATQDFKFFIIDRGTNTKVYESTQTVTLTTSFVLTSTPAFSLLLNAGSYDFGILGLSGNFHQNSQHNPGLTLAQNGLSVQAADYMSFYVNDASAANGVRPSGVRADRTLALQIETDAGAASVVPEPSTYALMGTGLIGLAGVARRRKK